MLENVVACSLGGFGRSVDVPWAVFLVVDEIFFAEDSEYRPDRRVCRRVGEVGHDLGDGRSAPPVKNVHDLSLSA